MPGREGALHHCPISVDSRGPGTRTSALCRSQELAKPRLPGSGLGTAHFLGAGEAIKDTWSPQDLCSCSSFQMVWSNYGWMSPDAGDMGLFPAPSRYLAVRVCWHGLPQDTQ